MQSLHPNPAQCYDSVSKIVSSSAFESAPVCDHAVSASESVVSALLSGELASHPCAQDLIDLLTSPGMKVRGQYCIAAMMCLSQ